MEKLWKLTSISIIYPVSNAPIAIFLKIWENFTPLGLLLRLK
jgi:hypothetical protein